MEEVEHLLQAAAKFVALIFANPFLVENCELLLEVPLLAIQRKGIISKCIRVQ